MRVESSISSRIKLAKARTARAMSSSIEVAFADSVPVRTAARCASLSDIIVSTASLIVLESRSRMWSRTMESRLCLASVNSRAPLRRVSATSPEISIRTRRKRVDTWGLNELDDCEDCAGVVCNSS